MSNPSTPPRTRLRAAVLGLLTLLAVLVPAAVAAPAASAAPCHQNNCPEPPPGPEPGGPHNPPAPHATHRLVVKKIVCYDRNDEQLGELYDEVYINFNGQRIWGKTSVSDLTGNPYTVNATKDVVAAPGGPYLGRLEMWDDDDTSADDKLAALDVYGNGSPTPISGTYDFHLSDAHYSVELSMQQL